MDKKKVMAMIGALGLTAGVLAGCGQAQDDDDYIKVVDSNGQTVYISEDELEDLGYDDDTHSYGGMFLLYSHWNGHNNTRLKPHTSFKGRIYSSKPSVSSAKSSGSGIGKSSTSSGKSSGFGG
jgi:hypothetical protein